MLLLLSLVHGQADVLTVCVSVCVCVRVCVCERKHARGTEKIISRGARKKSELDFSTLELSAQLVKVRYL